MDAKTGGLLLLALLLLWGLKEPAPAKAAPPKRKILPKPPKAPDPKPGERKQFGGSGATGTW